MHRSRLLALALTALLAAGIAPARATSSAPAAVGSLPGLAQLADVTGSTTGIATLDAVPTATVTSALRGLGLTVQPMEQLPLVLVRGPVAAMRLAATSGLVRDVYPDQEIELHDTASSNAMGAAWPRQSGFTGKGVTVAVVDSGCDATHPDLADHVDHNVKLISAEYANQAPDSSNTIVVPLDQGPRSNTDLGSGHGTHVAGIIAADGHTSPSHIGVAPDARLVCLSIGEVVATTAVITAYDFLLDQPGMWGVDVINNSWGNPYSNFDPKHPINVATKAVSTRGVDVVFSAGNSGEGNGEGNLNPWSQAPWVISVAAETVKHERGYFSSNGLRLDNSAGSAIGSGGRVTYFGPRIGVVHPDVAAPGVDISSTCSSTGSPAVVGPCPTPDNASASGTSMASPHVAGALAVLLQANPTLSNTQARWVLQTTAKPVKALDANDEVTSGNASFWQVGYGRVDLTAAVATARSKTAMSQLASAQHTRNTRVLYTTGYRVDRGDYITWAAPPASAGTDVKTFSVPKQSGSNRLRVAVMFPADTLVGVAGNVTEYSVVVKDARGKVIIPGTKIAGLNAATAFVVVPSGTVGPYSVTVTGDQSVSDPDTIDSDSILGDTVNLVVIQATR
jgi:serine protease AprX